MQTISVNAENLSDQIHTIIRKTQCCDTDRRLLQCARVFSTSLHNYVKQDMCLTCYGQHVDYNFVSGKQTNKYIVQLDADNKFHKTWVEQGWQLYMNETVVSICGSVKITCKIFFQLTSGVVKYLTSSCGY